MAISNRERVAKGLDYLREGLTPFVQRELNKHIGGFWYEELKTKKVFGLDRTPDGTIHWDVQALLKAMNDYWMDAFKDTLGHIERSWTNELREYRNRWAHDEAFSSDDADRALDTMKRLLEAVSASSQAEEIQKLRVDLQRIVFAEQARSKTRYSQSIEGAPKGGLRPWRELVTPHPDVASGHYIQAEFAADLHDVHCGIGGSEYTDPVEFFRRTFITDGLRELLTGALKRLSGVGGDPVIELQTNFGGGKTHSMLALYHMFGQAPATSLPGIENILKAVEAERPAKVNRAVLVGTHMSPAETSKKPDGTLIRTMWGEMAWQLGGKQGYALVADSDAKSTSPGAAVLSALFNKYAPCLILIDEWVAYSRQTVNHHDLPSGSFESQATFAQALTEAAKSAKKTLVVASVPTSNIEIGGDNGKYALDTLKNIVERLGTPWRPANADEGFEIVRRRLFEPISDRDAFAGRDAVIDAFARMYQENKADFPPGCAEVAYRRKLEAAYPIHPDVFDQLYGEWSTLDKFQRTRGVLRLLAKAIHRLWESNDSGLLILPASMPMDDAVLKSELTRYLEDQWEPVISEDVDGPNSLPLALDGQNSNLGRYSACRRVARTLYMGTAPGSKDKNPGIDDRRVRLGCTQPGEHAAIFGDALRRISDKAKHIHQDGNRYWISTKTNLNRLADDRASGLMSSPEELHNEIIRRIKEEYGRRNASNRGDFVGVHPCPEATSDVEDTPEVRLVILGPQHPHRKGIEDSDARKQARLIFESKGTSPRIYKNMVVFLASDSTRLDELMQATSSFMAWSSIQDEHETLNLDAFQRKQADSKAKEYDETVDARIKETWTWALVPVQREPEPGKEIKPEDLVFLEEIKVQGNEPLAKRTSTKLRNDSYVIPILGGTSLRLQLDRHLWKSTNHVNVSDLEEWFARYIYLPRIVSREVLSGAIKDGLAQMLIKDSFAIAADWDEAQKRYVGLQIPPNAGRAMVEASSLLVKPEAATEQVRAEKAAITDNEKTKEETTKGSSAITTDEIQPPRPKVKLKPTLFVGAVKIDASRLGRDAGQIAEEILQHLSTLPNSEVEVRLEIQVRVPEGVPDDVVRTVSENARTLKFETQGFEKE